MPSTRALLSRSDRDACLSREQRELAQVPSNELASLTFGIVVTIFAWSAIMSIKQMRDDRTIAAILAASDTTRRLRYVKTGTCPPRVRANRVFRLRMLCLCATRVTPTRACVHTYTQASQSRSVPSRLYQMVTSISFSHTSGRRRKIRCARRKTGCLS